jgi:hypothetical protein
LYTALGIGTGSLLCERLSGRKIEIGLVPFGSIGMTLFAVDIWLSSSAVPRRACGTWTPGRAPWRGRPLLVALFGGLFSVPLYALIRRAPAPHIAGGSWRRKHPSTRFSSWSPR